MNLPVCSYKIKLYKGPTINKMVHPIHVILESPRELKVIVFFGFVPRSSPWFLRLPSLCPEPRHSEAWVFPHETRGKKHPKIFVMVARI